MLQPLMHSIFIFSESEPLKFNLGFTQKTHYKDVT